MLSTGLAEHTRANVRQMQAKHPAAAQPSAFQPQQSDNPQLSFTTDQVMKGITSFRKGTAAGPTVLRAEHLRAATLSAPPNRRAKALEAVSRLVNIMTAGDVPEEVAPYLSVTQTACLGATRQDRALLPGTEARPADVLIPHWIWTGGRDTALDITVVNPLQARLVGQAATTAGHALTTAYNRKMTQAGEACRGEGIIFVPMPMEILGGWHEATVLQVKKLASAQARQTGEEQSDATRHLIQKLAVLLAKDNAALLLNRFPAFPSPDIDGIQ